MSDSPGTDAPVRLESRVGVVDCAVHPAPRSSDELKSYLPMPWKTRVLPDIEPYRYPAPFGEYLADTTPPDGGPPGSDPEHTVRQLFDVAGVDVAVLLPLTRGLLPDPEHGAAVAAATNDWLAATWLSEYNRHGRFKGSIRVYPMHPAKAVREIERWAGHPHFVQVAVPLGVHAPYGQAQYFPIWQAAAKHGLPVALHQDGGAGVELPPTSVGHLSHYLAYHTLMPVNAIAHLTSLICEGVFDRLESLVVVFADGAFDAFLPLLWRLDKDWFGTRFEVPWVGQRPLAYLRDHVRFIASVADGPEDPARLDDMLDLADAEHLLLFGSNYPHWDYLDPRTAFRTSPPRRRERILRENARDLYHLDVASPSQ